MGQLWDSMRVFAVSGYSGSGKTTVVEAIVRTLCARGSSIITVKSSKHDVKEETGTDSWRHRRAGAKTTIILGPESSIVHYGECRPLQDLLQGIDAEYLIIEGMKHRDIPKFWCIGDSEIDRETLPISVKAVVAWRVTENQQGLDVLIVPAHDIDRLITIIEEEAVNLSELDI
ncbi:molybdopterin-guanine dinucleotide biosynthesis protein B [Candidatus Thorarchaeota archaeon]|nr:MAG: molybdopterin-guanine dinucleotide biosynthesis protein B [Candidatus Thorarchaeota archaeon]